MDNRGQGALEYLIMTAAVLAVAAVVVTVISGTLTRGRRSADISKMQSDASSCSKALAAEGYSPGTRRAINSGICGFPGSPTPYDICSGPEWRDNTGQLTDGSIIASVTKEGNLVANTPYEACLAGKPSWVRQK